VTLDAYVLDTLMRDLVGHDRRPSAFLVYLYLWRRGAGGRGAVAVSLRDIAEGTGLSKRSVQDAIGWLARRRLIDVRRETITALPRYTVRRPWQR
jgi:CRP-like cAMP-binding protein